LRQAVRVVVIAPVSYRLRQGSKLLYRPPAYLICTDPDLPLEPLVQEYLWRWDIEVNFRDEMDGNQHVENGPLRQAARALRSLIPLRARRRAGARAGP
jgi:hypothetical protein